MHIDLINSPQKVKLCRKGFSYLKKNKLDKGWRIHSAGYAVLQFMRFGRINTIYMHKLFADQFLDKPESAKKLFVHMKNGEKLDCRLSNLDWATMGQLRRSQSSSDGLRGVSKDGTKYRAVLYDKGKRIYLGVYQTPEEAAKAYDDESYKRFGLTNSLNYQERFSNLND